MGSLEFLDRNYLLHSERKVYLGIKSRINKTWHKKAKNNNMRFAPLYPGSYLSVKVKSMS